MKINEDVVGEAVDLLCGDRPEPNQDDDVEGERGNDAQLGCDVHDGVLVDVGEKALTVHFVCRERLGIILFINLLAYN